MTSQFIASNAGLALAVGGTGLGQIDFTNLNISLDKIAYILSICASIYGMYLNKKKGKDNV